MLVIRFLCWAIIKTRELWDAITERAEEARAMLADALSMWI